MKKVLSILLVAAALFGFYGSAVNLNDVLACKDYWEEEGRKSTENMNKLEDGLNQLKDNEQAYLDGKEQVADGEKALADGEKTLADGEAQYEQGLKDYEAAPGKLADARKQIADGEAALADGQDAIDGLTKLINGIKQIRNGYNKTWRPGYEALKDGRNQLYSGSKSSKDSLTALAAFLPDDEKASYVAAVKDVASDDGKQTAKDYKEFIKSTNTLEKDIPKIQKAVETTYNNANGLLSLLRAQEDNFDFAKTVSAQKEGMLALASLIEQANGSAAAETYKATVNAVANAYDNFDATVDKQYEDYLKSDEGKATEEALIEANMDQGWAGFWQTDNGKAALKGTKMQIWQAQGGDASADYDTVIDKAIPDDTAKTAFRNSGSDSAKAAEAGIREQVKTNVDAGIKASVKEKVLAVMNDTDPTKTGSLAQARYALTTDYDTSDSSQDGGVIGVVVSSLKAINEQVNGEDSALKNQLLPGIKKFNAAATEDKIDALSDGQDDIASGIATVASAVLGNSTLKSGVKKNFGSKAIKLLNTYKSAKGPLSTSASNFAAFEKQMDSKPGVERFLEKAQKLLAKTKADGLKTLAEGKKKLADGKAQYAQGLKDYAEAPAKLADAEKQLADGRQQLADGRQALEDGKAQLAQYEDGEQQVRDGLATLAGTEADLDLESILDRLGGDADFDNGDNHLELDEGLAAVEIGRAYQADDGDLITEEIMARAVGTGALLGAGALAIIAAILSFLKKNKGAGVFAILAAAAGAFGAFYGTQAGTYFSSIAGSTVGATGWVAAGILGAVALVHSIVHFTAKKVA